MIRIALLGDQSDDVIAHRAIPLALQLTAEKLSLDCDSVWLHSNTIDSSQLSDYQGFWCVPNSPYANPQNIINAIRFARETGVTFLGTCGGYQHAVLEYARHVLGYKEAGNAEDDPDTSMPIINAMFCALREKSGQINLSPHSLLATLYQQQGIEEQYNCGFGVNPDYLSLFDNTDLQFTGHDADNDPRAFELRGHPFFVGTAFQPERSALTQQVHPLIEAFVTSASN